KPDDADAWHARGFALKLLRRRAEALSCFDKAVMLAPKNATIRASRANMLFEVERFDDAARDYEILLAEEGAPAWVQGYLTMCRLHCCDWRGLGDARARISHELKVGHFVLDPTGNAIVSSSLEEQLQCARI